MLPLMDQLKSQVGTLTTIERARLADFLRSPLDAEEEVANEAYWAEVAQRTAEIRAGTAQGVDGDEFMAELRKMYP